MRVSVLGLLLVGCGVQGAGDADAITDMSELPDLARPDLTQTEDLTQLVDGSVIDQSTIADMAKHVPDLLGDLAGVCVPGDSGNGPCGCLGQPCCSTNFTPTCGGLSGDSTVICGAGTCIHCGGEGEPCCGNGTGIATIPTCAVGTCKCFKQGQWVEAPSNQQVFICQVGQEGRSMCSTCGGESQSCCVSGTSCHSAVSTALTCRLIDSGSVCER
jgi:hypothetical protein